MEVRQEGQTVRQAVVEAAGLLVALLLATALLSLLGIGCPIRYFAGVSCPGCGMTRAWLEALQLDFAAAFAYHPLFWLVPPAVILSLLPARTARARRAVTALAVVAIAALLALWFARLANPCDLMLLGDLVGPGDVVGWGRPGWLDWLAGLR